MSRPCKDWHPLSPETCRLCFWCVEPGEKGRFYREQWGEPEPAGPPVPAWKLRMAQSGACARRGSATGETVACGECGARHVQLPVLSCAKHGKCVERIPADKTVRSCRGCTDREAPKPSYEWVSTAQLLKDAVTLAGLLPPDTAGIVGIPRSGMLPASAIATLLHLPLWELTPSGPRPLGAGSRGPTLHRATGPLAVVDDTVYGGGAMRRARGQMGGKPAIYCAVYARPEAAGVVNLYARELKCPHLLEWNLINNGPSVGYAAPSTNGVFGRGVAWDFDGIICHDDLSGGKPGTPYMVPRQHPARLIVTGRPESARSATEEWIRHWGAKVERMIMFPDDMPWSWQAVAAFKAKHYADSGCGFYVESDPLQAEEIHRLCGLPVICPVLDKVFT